METLSYGQFSLELRRRLGSRRIPTTGTIEVTRRCPLECAHCYNNLPMGDEEAGSREMKLGEHRRLLDEIVEAGCLWLLYTGGEVLARRDFLDIYTYAKEKGLLITLFTNGTLITPKVADHFARWRPFSIEITLYGRTRETYEALTGIPGSYDRCLRGIHLLRERGLPLKLKTVAVTINRHEVAAMQRFAEELGVEFKFDALMNPRLDCSRSPLEVRLKPEEVVELDLGDPERAQAFRELAALAGAPAEPALDGEVYHCGGGESSFAVDPYGRMSICVLSHFDSYDLRAGSFREGWEGFLHKVRRKRITRVTKCTACRLQSLCGMCPANGELENGDPEAPVDFLCRVAHLRAHALGIPVPAHGDCEYCPGGGAHEEMASSAAALRVRSPLEGRAPQALSVLPVLPGAGARRGGGCSSGGCSSCGKKAEHAAALAESR